MKWGAALPVMLFLLALTSALAVAGVFVTRQVVASVRASERSAEVEPAAERVLVDAIARWDTLRRPLQGIGSSEAITDVSTPGISTAVWVTRISDRMYWLVAEARGGTRPLLRHRLGVLVRITNRVAAPVPIRAWTPLP